MPTVGCTINVRLERPPHYRKPGTRRPRNPIQYTGSPRSDRAATHACRRARSADVPSRLSLHTRVQKSAPRFSIAPCLIAPERRGAARDLGACRPAGTNARAGWLCLPRDGWHFGLFALGWVSAGWKSLTSRRGGIQGGPDARWIGKTGGIVCMALFGCRVGASGLVWPTSTSTTRYFWNRGVAFCRGLQKVAESQQLIKPRRGCRDGQLATGSDGSEAGYAERLGPLVLAAVVRK
ncbi:hypothetical protein P171DRAFT_100694 [Karstenula rhodostoma CBS 690.94]|uniref:Uncharacterized protein n=1 Tax=Karstenula rhodostoma CBS 690.94 TaxID=1392251 RepID=A0A9P4U7S2_9PLEO|nr:hypothetical protein P171DRAFT_100694 [Karstenula rhodostoma CBS 690.94]